jgi:DNA polymerase type B, organellar and viral
MMQDGSVLMPLLGKPKSRKFLVLDVESKDGFSQRAGFTRPFQVGVYDGHKYYTFFDKEPCTEENWRDHYYRDGGCVDRAMRFILQRKYRGWHIYAHNAGRFDYLFLMPWLMQIGVTLGFNFGVIPVASSIQVLDVWEGESRHALFRFLDSLKLMPTSLDKAAKSFGLKGKDKSALAEDLDTPETDRNAWIAYNRVDCVQLYRILEKFHHYVENVLLGEVGITAPATSMKIYRRRFLKHGIPRALDTHDFVRSGYKGGRTEPFIRHGTGLRYYDINSSYPAAMLELMPAGDASWCEGKPAKRLLDGKHIGFVEARVYVPEGMNLPPLPVTQGKLIFPVGRLEGVWEWSELQMAVEHGCEIVEFKRSCWYPAVPLFREFVEELYQYRDKSSPLYDEGLAEVVKIMLNSLYGKFGMKTLRKQIYLWNDPELPEGAVPCSGEPDCPVWYAETESDAPYVMPQISARVTSLARQRLYRGMVEIEQGGGRVYYVDTDSIITDGTMRTSSALGDFKDEFPELSGRIIGDFVAPKLYMLSAEHHVNRRSGSDTRKLKPFSKVKAKGVSFRKERHESQDDVARRMVETFHKLARGEQITLDRLEKIGTLAREGFSRGPMMKKVPRRFLAEDGKRTMQADGTSKPLVLNMWKK